MFEVKSHLKATLATLPPEVQLVAISKFHPSEYIMAAYEEGQRIFGESHEQELKTKHQELPSDIKWHFIGHLQTNKVKQIVPYIDTIQSVDSIRLLREVNKQAGRIGRTINVLLEIHVATEETKFGFSQGECLTMLREGEWRQMNNVRICGIMAMASNTDNLQQVASEFAAANSFFNELKKEFFASDDFFCERSWGMSDDYPIAIANGSTMVRIGTRIFGPRVY